MEIQGFEITSQAINDAFCLLANLLGMTVKIIKAAVLEKDQYQTIFISKSSGKGKRRLDIPPHNLRKVQGRLLEGCLYHIRPWPATGDWAMLTGYRPGRSIYNNMRPHLYSRTFLQLDLTNAFPSVTTEMIREALTPMFEEVSVKNMFHFRQVRWFRRKFLEQKAGVKKRPTPDDDSDNISDEVKPLDVLYALREIILWLTMFEDKLPQGAPTSPHLFNMVVAHQRLPTILEAFHGTNPFVVTVYADNITISTKDENISPETIEKIIGAIESKTPFKVNRDKTRLVLTKHGSPNITGLSIGRKMSGPNVAKLIVTVPQEVQRRTRGLLHRAIYDHKLREQALGMAAYMLCVYRGKSRLPPQISRPYKQLLAAIKQQ